MIRVIEYKTERIHYTGITDDGAGNPGENPAIAMIQSIMGERVPVLLLGNGTAQEKLEAVPAPVPEPERKTQAGNKSGIGQRKHSHLEKLEYDEAGFPAVMRAWRGKREQEIGSPIGTTKFAEFMGLHATDISSYLTGNRRIGRLTLERMAAAFGVTPEEFLKGPGGRDQRQESNEAASGKPVEARKPEQKQEEPESKLSPIVAEYCKSCRASGDGYCTGCRIKKALTCAERQETPGDILLGAKAAACAGCKDYKTGGKDVCTRCRLGAFWRAKMLFETGKGMVEAIAIAEKEYQAAFEGK